MTVEMFDRADFDGDCEIDLDDWSAFMSQYGASGDLSLHAKFTWDGENRLTRAEPVSPGSGSKRIDFKYDALGRRVEKMVTEWNAGGSPPAWKANPVERRRFIWSGWLMLLETIDIDSASDGTFETTRVKKYTWGRDLGGTDGGHSCGGFMSPVSCITGAGGIGGLLAVFDDNSTSADLNYVYFYDVNGNVGQVCDLTQSTASASIVAKYEYDAYGNVSSSGGSYATANTFRFSTKFWDDETGLGYWGYRYYDSRMGRWFGRDPVGEFGGVHLYAACLNNPIWRYDILGLVSPPRDIKIGLAVSSDSGCYVIVEARENEGKIKSPPGQNPNDKWADQIKQIIDTMIKLGNLATANKLNEAVKGLLSATTFGKYSEVWDMYADYGEVYFCENCDTSDLSKCDLLARQLISVTFNRVKDHDTVALPDSDITSLDGAIRGIIKKCK